MGEWFKSTRFTEGSIDIHPEDAERLGFTLDHPSGMTEFSNGRRASLYRPVTVEIMPGGLIDSTKYRKCPVCKQDHEPLVIAFLDDYRTRVDTKIVKLSEEREREWESEGYGRHLAHRAAEAGLSDDELTTAIDAAIRRKGGNGVAEATPAHGAIEITRASGVPPDMVAVAESIPIPDLPEPQAAEEYTIRCVCGHVTTGTERMVKQEHERHKRMAHGAKGGRAQGLAAAAPPG